MGGATTKYRLQGAGARRYPGGVGACFALVLLAWGMGVGRAAAGADPAAAARNAFGLAEAAYKSSPGTGSNAWQFARACFDLAEFASKSSERADLAQQGIKAAQQAVAQDSKSAPPHYYLGMDLGQLARTKSLGALRLVNQMEREFKQARELDEHFDYAGSDRNLGLLYRDAPSITSVGSRSKARQHLERAVELAPNYPENRLCLMEAYMKWGERAEAQKQLQSLQELWPGAQKTLTGEVWASSWTDWDQRLKQARAKLDPPGKAPEGSRPKR